MWCGRRSWRERETVRRTPLTVLLCGAVMVAVLIEFAEPASAAIASRGVAAIVTYRSDSTTSIAIAVPSGAQPGDLLVGSVGAGRNNGSSPPVLSAPAGWVPVAQVTHGLTDTLAVFTHVYVAGETTYTWTTNTPVAAVAFVGAFSGVDAAAPVDVWSVRESSKKGTSVTAPSVTTSATGTQLVASYFGYRGKGSGSTWSPPNGMTELGDAAESDGRRSGNMSVAAQDPQGATGDRTAFASAPQDYALATLVALRRIDDALPPSAPVISGVAAAVGSTGATVTWATNQPANSQVEYGTTAAYGTSSPLDPAMVNSHSVTLAGLLPGTDYHYRVQSSNATGQQAVSVDQLFHTAGGGGGGPVPLIVDTDIFSDADDVGALATAFGHQLRGEARVIALGVNTRTSRPAVTTNSWRCAAAVAQFYNSASIPIGTAMPNNGTERNTPDFAGPCARLASGATPAPDTAVNVFRRALVSQPDGAVVMVEAGYMGNLSALLNSGPDGISGLDGRSLIARKVNRLVVMGGGYPSRAGENNLIGDPASAQNVATNWPSSIVWSGYEVGDLIHTGNTISSVHPSSSPVRVSYEAFVGPNNWIYSYDLTAVYHAVRPSDPLLTLVGPGRNVINSQGWNVFTLGSGNQYYLSLSNAAALDASIESLLDTLPTGAPTDTTPPVVSVVAAGPIGSTTASVTWTTDEAADSQVEYGPTVSYGSNTGLDAALVPAHAQALSGLSPGTTYHYRVKSRDGAGNLAISPDFTLATVTSAGAGPTDNFDTNVIDTFAWTVSGSGSSVSAVNKQLEITHTGSTWTIGALESRTTHDQTGRSLQLQVKRPANAGQGGATYGETSIMLSSDSTHRLNFFMAGNSVTAWIDNGTVTTNLTPSWPRYDPAAMQWLRFRESGGTVYWEVAGGSGAPGPWTVVASAPVPFAINAVTLRIVAGSNVVTTDTAVFDNISTT